MIWTLLVLLLANPSLGLECLNDPEDSFQPNFWGMFALYLNLQSLESSILFTALEPFVARDGDISWLGEILWLGRPFIIENSDSRLKI